MSARSTIRWSRYAPSDIEVAAEIGRRWRQRPPAIFALERTASSSQERTAASMIRISTPPSLRMTCDRSKDAPHTRSSKSGAGVSRHARPASTIARAQSMQGKNVVVRWAPAVDTPRRAASKMARRSACSIQTNRPSPAWRSSRARTPAGNVLQAAISVPSRATRTAPTLRTRFGLKEAARRAISILASGAARWLATSISRALAMFAEARRPLTLRYHERRAASHHQLGLTRPTSPFAHLTNRR
jgi:hypothetical protein